MSARRRRSAHPPMTAVAMPIDKLDLCLSSPDPSRPAAWDRRTAYSQPTYDNPIAANFSTDFAGFPASTKAINIITVIST